MLGVNEECFGVCCGMILEIGTGLCYRLVLARKPRV